MEVQPRKSLVMFQVKFKSDIHGAIEEIVGYGHIDAAAVLDAARRTAREWRKAFY